MSALGLIATILLLLAASLFGWSGTAWLRDRHFLERAVEVTGWVVPAGGLAGGLDGFRAALPAGSRDPDEEVWQRGIETDRPFVLFRLSDGTWHGLRTRQAPSEAGFDAVPTPVRVLVQPQRPGSARLADDRLSFLEVSVTAALGAIVLLAGLALHLKARRDASPA